MSLICKSVRLPKGATGLVVRPPVNHDGGEGAPQVLVFFGDEIRELHEDTFGTNRTYFVSPHRLEVGGELRDAALPTYEPVTDCVYFRDGCAVKRLTRNDTIEPVAGRQARGQLLDGRGEAARFGIIFSLAADGKGRVFIADETIRVLDVRTGDVTTLRGTEPFRFGSEFWSSVAYDGATDTLLAATSYVICRLRQSSSGAVVPQGIAGGNTKTFGYTDGRGASAGFMEILSMVPGEGGVVYVTDSGRIRCVDSAGGVTTLYKEQAADLVRWQLVLLPGGELAATTVTHDPSLSVFVGGRFKPSSAVLAGWVPPAHTAARPAASQSSRV